MSRFPIKFVVSGRLKSHLELAAHSAILAEKSPEASRSSHGATAALSDRDRSGARVLLERARLKLVDAALCFHGVHTIAIPILSFLSLLDQIENVLEPR